MVSVGCAALAALVPACGSSDSGGGGSSGSSGGSSLAVNTFTGTGDAVNGKTLYDGDATCTMCHGPGAVGSLGPNITFSTTAGIGGWTEEQFFQVVRNSKSRAGNTVCKYMSPTADGKPFTVAMVSDKGIGDIFAYLQTTSSDTVNKGSYLQLDSTCSTQ